MKVLFQTRTNLYTAPGGDLIQIQKTKEYLEKLGVKVDISLEFEPDLTDYDVVHLFNLMDPQDIYLQCVNAKKQNKKVVLSTIYGLYTEYERKARGGLAQKLANILSPYQIGYLKIIIRHYHENRFHKGVKKLLFRGYYGLMKDITKNVDVFLPNSISEMKRVAAEFKLKEYNFEVVPNSIDKAVFDNSKVNTNSKYAKYKDCILCAARIEGRKSTLNLIRAVKNTKYTLVLVGNESKNQKKYVDQVHAEAGSNIFFLGPIPHEELKELYQVAKVHALVSWMETPGLSSIEAAAMGCNIVVTKKGDTEEYFENYAFYCQPNDVNSIKEAIDNAYSTPFDEELKAKILREYTWEKAALKTLKAYETANNQ
ncbi:glycosyltransferase family 4 protein [Flavobacterium soli]|uniref:glycosyltransferase family 4 protein n=1 Tax=Flavobacterium soli TaxID=344881 RepID=UPI0004245235|nr:glycosyltransferase family 4 protein [Flavobacterium soli]